MMHHIQRIPIAQTININKSSDETTAILPWLPLGERSAGPSGKVTTPPAPSYLHVRNAAVKGSPDLTLITAATLTLLRRNWQNSTWHLGGASNLKQKDVSSHVTVNFKPVHTWHNILALPLRNTLGVINCFNMLRHNDLSWLFMFLEMGGESKSGDIHTKVLLCCIRDIFMGHFVNIEQASFNYS